MPASNARRSYALAWLALSALAGVSLGLRFVPLGAWGTPAALAIAAVKAAIVLFAFMHFARETPAVRLLALLTLAFVLLLCAGVVADVALR
jgi:cytochrome c oxidase subunit 4